MTSKRHVTPILPHLLHHLLHVLRFISAKWHNLLVPRHRAHRERHQRPLRKWVNQAGSVFTPRQSHYSIENDPEMANWSSTVSSPLALRMPFFCMCFVGDAQRNNEVKTWIGVFKLMVRWLLVSDATFAWWKKYRLRFDGKEIKLRGCRGKKAGPLFQRALFFG